MSEFPLTTFDIKVKDWPRLNFSIDDDLNNLIWIWMISMITLIISLIILIGVVIVQMILKPEVFTFQRCCQRNDQIIDQ